MALLFGILFRNPDTGTCAQLGLETGSNNLYVRSMEKTGGWSDWERIGGSGGGSSSTTTPTTPAPPATTTANAALRLVSALTLSLTGDASGSVSFNGSEGRVSLPVTVTKTAAGGGSTGSTGGGGGTGAGGGGGSSSVIMANSALRLAAPLKLTLEGDASGSVSFDGSEGVVKLQVSVAKKVAGSDAVTEARAEEIARKVAAQLVEEHRRAYDHYTKSEN